MYVNGKEICNLCGAGKQELADVKAELRLTLDALRTKDIEFYDLKKLVVEYTEMMEVFDHATYIDGHDELLDRIEQACTLANDSKEK